MADKTPVAPMDPARRNSPIAAPAEEESTVMLDTAASVCYWNDQEFAEEARVDCDGETYECSFGRWVKNG